MRTVQEGWESYSKNLPKNASKAQIVETQRAFFGGAAVMLGGLAELGEADLSDEAASKVLDGYEEELNIFFTETIFKQ